MPLQWLLGAACALSDPTAAAVADPSAVDPAVVVITSLAAASTPGVDAPADDAVLPGSPVAAEAVEQGPALTSEAEQTEQASVPPKTPPSEPASTTDGAAGSAATLRDVDVVMPGARPTSQRRKVPWLGPLGITGIVVGAVGLGGVAVSGVLLTRGPKVEVDPTDRTTLLTTDYDPPGWIFYGVGLGVMVVGASALAIDVTVGRDRRARRMRLQPQLGRGQAGVAVHGRF